MNGTISVVNLPPELKPTNKTSSQEIGTVGAYMISAIMLDKYTSEFEERFYD
jgi:hypothetical protein